MSISVSLASIPISLLAPFVSTQFSSAAPAAPPLLTFACLSSGDDSCDVVEAHGQARGHGKGPCDVIGAILKGHASTCLRHLWIAERDYALNGIALCAELALNGFETMR